VSIASDEQPIRVERAEPMTLDWKAIAQESVTAVQVGATFSRDLPVHRKGLLEVTLRRGTRVSLRVDEGGLNVHAAPALVAALAGPLPDVSFATARYDFHRARFDVDANAGIVGPIVEALIEGYLNGELKKKLPAPLLRRDYRPQRDADLAGTVRAVTSLLPLGGGGGGSGGLPDELAHAGDLAVHLTLTTQRDVVTEAPGLDDTVVRIPKDARLFVEAHTSGSASSPSLRDIVVKANGRGVIIASNGPGLLASLEAIEISRMTITPGPKLAFEYELLVERLLNAPAVLMRFAELLAGRYSPDAQGNIVLESLRPNITKMLEEAVGNLLRDLLSEYDRVVPGLSLRAVFGG
jgi:hypothetical protein